MCMCVEEEGVSVQDRFNRCVVSGGVGCRLVLLTDGRDTGT